MNNLFLLFHAKCLYEKNIQNSLRQHISVIPQVPFLFRGTVRQNIDPFKIADTQRIWDVLE